jgi:RNA 2',3'-cyclic 3'-phosphodiesterase
MRGVDPGEGVVDETQRLFIAIELPPEVRRWLENARTALEPGMPAGAVRWVDPRGIHITLKFLGETAVQRIDGVRTAMDQAVQETQPFPLVVEGLGCFPNTARPRVLWAGVRSERKLAEIQKRLEDNLYAAGFEREGRAFSPHLTLGRVRDGAGEIQWRKIGAALAAARIEPPVEMRAGDLCLFRSVLGPAGAEYSVLHRVGFSGR